MFYFRLKKSPGQLPALATVHSHKYTLIGVHFPMAVMTMIQLLTLSLHQTVAAALT